MTDNAEWCSGCILSWLCRTLPVLPWAMKIGSGTGKPPPGPGDLWVPAVAWNDLLCGGCFPPSRSWRPSMSRHQIFIHSGRRGDGACCWAEGLMGRELLRAAGSPRTTSPKHLNQIMFLKQKAPESPLLESWRIYLLEGQPGALL